MAVATRLASVPGLWLLRATVADGAELAMTTSTALLAALDALPSEAVTRRPIASPLLPWPATERSRVAPVAAARSVPFLVHW